MAKKGKSENKQDLSSFMSVLIMTIGCLTILLVANTLIIASNPENLEITSIFVSNQTSDEGDVGQPMFENTSKEPAYIDVYKDYLVIYPGEIRVLAGELEQTGSPFEKLLARTEAHKDREYIVMLLRPKSALFARRVRSLIRDRGIDVGQELYEEGKPVNYNIARAASGTGPAESVAEAPAPETPPAETPPPAPAAAAPAKGTP